MLYVYFHLTFSLIAFSRRRQKLSFLSSMKRFRPVFPDAYRVGCRDLVGGDGFSCIKIRIFAVLTG